MPFESSAAFQNLFLSSDRKDYISHRPHNRLAPADKVARPAKESRGPGAVREIQKDAFATNIDRTNLGNQSTPRITDI
jgi:hypothetical protein